MREKGKENKIRMTGAVRQISKKDKEVHKVVYGEKEMRMIPLVGIDKK